MIERPKMNEVRPDRNFAITMEAAPRIWRLRIKR